MTLNRTVDWLYSLPEIVLLVLPAGIVVLLMIFLPRVVQRLPGLAPSDANTDFVLRLQPTLFTMSSLVLAFTLVQADSNFRHADSLVSTEAARIDQLDRLLSRYGEASVREIRPMLLAYATSIVRDEWPEMLHSKGHEATGRAFADISQRILAIEPVTPRQTLILGEMLKTLDSMSDARATRLNMLTLALIKTYWIVVAFSLAMLVFVTCTIERSAPRTVILAVQASVLGAFLGFVFIMDQPFKGERSVGPDAIVQTIGRISQRAG